MKRGLAALAVGAASVGAALALAADGPQQPAAPPPRNARPEVPGSARALVPFGMETTADGPRAWALGQADGRTVVLRRAPRGGWAAAPLPVAGQPVGGPAPQHAGAMSADGHGAVLLADPDHPEQDATLLTRGPGASFTAAPAPGTALQGSEQLVAGATTAQARALLAVVGGADADAATLVAPTDADGITRAVLRLDAGGWHREDLDTASLGGPVHPVALAAAGPARAWLLGTAADHVVLLHREPRNGGATGDWQWVPVTPAHDVLLGGGPLPAAVAAVAVAAPPADPLTATADGLWIDLRVTPAGAADPVDATEHLAVADPFASGTPSSGTPSSGTPSSGTPSSGTPSSGTPASSSTPEPPATASTTPSATEDGRWCDLAAAAGAGSADAPLCDHRLGFAFARGDRGYRSVATAAPAGDAGAPFGTREISAPVDLGVAPGAPRRDAERQGGFAQLAGDAFALRGGIGEDGSSTTQAIAFAADGTGFTGGAIAFGAVTAARPATVADVAAPSFGDSLAAAAAAPNHDGRVFALSRQGGSLLLQPDGSWTYPNTGLLSQSPHGRYAPLRAVVWPRPGMVIGVGSAGALVTALADPAPFDPTDVGEDSAQRQAINDDDLSVEATLLAVACTDGDPLECVAAGRDGLIVRGDGRTWHVEHLPDDAPAHTDITSVAYDGRTPLLATSDGLYTGVAGEDRWTRDDDLRDRMRAAGQPTAIARVATEPGGGTVVDGRFERDAPTAPWRPTTAPLDLHPVAIAAVRENGVVRTIVSATPNATPLPTPVAADEDDRNPPTGKDRPRHEPVPPDPAPADAVVLRETADGWVDLDGGSYQPSGGRDLPETTPNTQAMVLDADGSGLLLGGQAGIGPDLRTASPVAATTSVRRLDHGAAPADPAPGAASQPAENLLPAGTVRLAVGGHPACLDRCTGGDGQGITADVHLSAAIDRVHAMAAAGAGPAALVLGGGRASAGGEPLDPAGARRYHALTEGAGVPTYVLPGPGDLAAGGGDAFDAAFADAPAPEGTGDPPAGVDLMTIPQPEDAPSGAARRVFAFDVQAPAGSVRVIAIDNASGRLAGGTDGAQAQWIRDTMDQARDLSIPSVVVGSASLDGAQGMPRAEDADAEIALLAGHASAYVATAGVDDPGAAHFGGVLSETTAMTPGATAPLPVFQSSTLGYAPTRAAMQLDRYDPAEFNRQTAAALMLLDVGVAQLDHGTGIAPVTASAEPLVRDVGLDSSLRQMALGFALPLSVAATDPAPQRFIWRTVDGGPEPASAFTGEYMPFGQCSLWEEACDSTVATDLTFTSSNPQVARFVAVRRGTDPKGHPMPEVVLDADGHVVDDPRGVFCPLALGTTDVTATVAGQRVTATITVVPATLPRSSNVHMTPIPPGTCGFPVFTQVKKPDDQPAAAPVPPPAPVPTPIPQPAPHHPAHHHAVQHPHHVAAQAPAPAPPAPAPPPPLVQQPTPDHARPPVAPAAKPPAPAAPPAPPQGLSAQPVHATQVSAFQATQAQQERRREQAFEGDSAAVAYAHPPSPLPWELLGGAAVLALAIAGGSVAGRARRRAVAPAYVTTRRR